jgi:NAD(P)H-dependent FMN reductase
VVISTPEYAHALPGSFKNGLDWLVSDPAFAGKRVVIVKAERGSDFAAESLREVLRTMSANILEEGCVSLALTTNSISPEQILSRDDLRSLLEASVQRLVASFRRK